MGLINVHETLRSINTDSNPIYVLDTDLYDVHGDALQIMLYPLINQQMKITDGAMVINEMHVQSWPKARINQQVVWEKVNAECNDKSIASVRRI